ncbi:MAG TPA: hypothetical protein VFJ64_07435 [Solirubrobacterales bacterium]|nr:hypothetical protein [Solirubrobacterales bacterium]
MAAYTSVPVEDLIDAGVAAANGGRPLIFFLGAGASRPSPSCLPSPETIQAVVLDQVIPTGAHKAERAHLEGSLPEIYHEILAHLGGPRAREIWRCLSFWESPPEAPAVAALGLGPNLVHLLTVYLSWRCGLPLVTVNFDQMLERAAERLGLEPVLSPGAAGGADSVAIWKIHGSVDDIGSIRTTLQSITAGSPRELTVIEREFCRAQGCLIGYSGRDIDFFPFLCGWKGARPIYWLDLNFEGTAIERFSQPFLAIEGVGAEEWARRMIERLPANNRRAELLKAELSTPLPEMRAVDDVYRQAIEGQAESLLRPMLAGREERRILIHALALASIGRNREAWDWLDRFFAAPRSPDLECRAELLRAALSHEHSRYLDSRAHALRALRLAKRQRLRPQAVEAVLAADEALRMSTTTRFRFARAKASAPAALEQGAALLAMAWHALRFLPRQIPWKRTGGSRPDFDQLRATFAYLEHLVRIGAFGQGIAERLLPGPLVKAAAHPWWGLLRRWSGRIGYAAGIGNAKKYQLRQVAPATRDEDAFSASSVYELISSPTGRAIDLRDRAEAAGDPAEANSLYDQALVWAERAGNTSLLLKAMEGKKSVDPSYAPTKAEVETLLDRVQGPAYDRIRDSLVAFLTR